MSQLSYQAIFDQSPIAKVIVNEQSKIYLVNRQAALMFEYANEEMVGEDITMLIPQDTRASHPALVKRYFSRPLPREMGAGRELVGVRKNESKFPIEIALSPIALNDRTYVVAAIVDITERVRTETERLQAEQQFRAAIDAAPSAMIMINHRGQIVLANQKTVDIFGYTKGELANQPVELLIPPEYKAPHPTLVQSYIAKPEPREMSLGRELFGRHKSGQLVPVEIGLHPVQVGENTFVISSILDLTERRKIEHKSQERSDEISEFSYRTSHDLKSPLSTVGGLIDFVIEDINSGNLSEACTGATKIKRITERLNRLVDDILLLTKADHNHEPHGEFDFDAYLAEANDKFDQMIADQEVSVTGSFLHRKALTTQTTRLSQILDNLVSNGIKYSDPRKTERFVRINSFNDANKFYIRVEDNGIGIPKDQHGAVFSMFKRFHTEEHPIDGTGLGLYMIKKHIANIGADIKFESGPEGTTFYIELPLSLSHPNALPENQLG